MRVVQATSYTGVKQGGPSVVTPALVSVLLAKGVEIDVIGQLWSDDLPVAWPSQLSPQIIPTTDNSGFGYSAALKRPLAKAIAESDLTHSHGLWMYLTYATGKLTRTFKKPHVITPHGMLDPWILARSVKKKELVRRLYQDRVVSNAACLHALCKPEANQLRNLGFKNPIAIIPNGIHLQEFATLPSRETFHRNHPELKGRKVILYLSRIHPKKGLLHLVQAWSQLAAQFPDWQVVIAGPDEMGHRAEVEREIEGLALTERVTFIGTVSGPDKLAALAAAEFFVLPSFSEGFSMAILEAMACKLPVLLTPGCNFPEAVTSGAAVQVNPEVSSVQQGLLSLLQMNASEREQMGQNGHDLVVSRYTWDQVGQDMFEVYQWCLGGGAAPASIISSKVGS